jgi:hypothetical protein
MKIGKWWFAAGLISADIADPARLFEFAQRPLADLLIVGFRSIRAGKKSTHADSAI